MKKILNLKFVLFGLICIVLIGLAGTTYYLYNQYQQVKNNPDLIAQREKKSIIQTIKKHIDLPENEEPSLITITDIKKLKDQDFFVNAQNGDKVLLYVNSSKAILYRPKSQKIINFAPLVLRH